MVELRGRIVFDPEVVTKKHDRQSTWKKVAVVQFDQDEYHSMWRWFMKSRFNLSLNQPLRGSHVTFINDRFSDQQLWDRIKEQYDGQSCCVRISNVLRSNGEHWWLKIFDVPEQFKEIRSLLGIGDYIYPYHYTIGLANHRNKNHSEYIRKILENGI